MSADKGTPGPADPSGRRGDPGSGDATSEVAATFLKEVTILFLGVLIGFLWRTYTEEVTVTHEGHVIVLLLLVIFCLGRYIGLTRR